MLKFTILILVFSSVGLLASQIMPLITEKFHRAQTKKVGRAERQLDEMFMLVQSKRLFLFYTLSPLILGGLSFLLLNKFIAALIGMGIGFILPTLIIKRMEALRKQRLQYQLLDALTLLSSSLKAGLSFLQAIEVLVEEMAAPISQEFGLVLRENKMGVSLEESLSRLNKRAKLEELELIVDAIVVARETGGDLTKVFSRLSATIRDNRKLKESIKTLTLQGRIQGIIMLLLPFVFIWWVLAFNRSHFEIMLNSELGRILVLVALCLQTIGMLLIHRFSMMRF